MTKSNGALDKNYRFSKLRPIIDQLNKNFKSSEYFHIIFLLMSKWYLISIDIRRKCLSKENPSYLFLRFGAWHHPTQTFFSFSHRSRWKKLSGYSLGLGAQVVLDFLKKSSDPRNYHIYFDIFLVHITFFMFLLRGDHQGRHVR